MKKHLFLLIFLSSCSLFSPSGNEPNTLTRDTSLFPDRKYPLRITEVEFRSIYGGNNRGDALFMRNMADTAVAYNLWKIRIASNGFVTPLNNLGFSFAGVNGFVLSPAVTVPIPVNALRSDRRDTLRRIADTIEVIAPDGQITQRIAWGNKQFLTPILPFWRSTSPLRISFVIPNPIGNDTNNEIVMVQNTTLDTVQLANWTLKSKQGGQVKFLTEKIIRLLPLQKYDFRFTSQPWLNNEGDSVTLIAPNGTEVHTATWGNFVTPENVYFYPAP